MDVDESGVTTEGVKLSMFDISDPSDVREVQKYVIEDMYGTDVYDYRSVFADVEKNLFGFTAYGSGQKYYIFSYDENKGFRQELKERWEDMEVQEVCILETGFILYREIQ